MASITHSADFTPGRLRPATSTQHPVGLGRLYRRLVGALEARRQREVERDNARLLARHGMRITDSFEREMMDRVFASDWRPPD
jgi:hypothetical protein